MSNHSRTRASSSSQVIKWAEDDHDLSQIAGQTRTIQAQDAFSSSESLSFLPSKGKRQSQPALKHASNQYSGSLWTRLSNGSRDLVARNKGLLMIGASQFFMACMSCIVKLMSSRDDIQTSDQVIVPTLELIAVRMAITWLCSLAWMLHQKIPHPVLGPPGIRQWLVIRGVVGFFGLFGMYFSVQYLSLSDATVITFLSPTVTAFLGYVLLKENFSKKEAFAGMASLLGVILIARPSFLFGSSRYPHLGVGTSEGHPDITMGEASLPKSSDVDAGDHMRLVAVGVALIGVLGASGAYISLRRISKHAHTMHSISYFCAWCVLVSVSGMTVLRIPWVLPPDWKWALGLLAIGFFGFGGQVLLTTGLQNETAGRGALALYVLVVFALGLERIFFHVKPSLLSMIGMVIILSSAIFVALSKPASIADVKSHVASTSHYRDPNIQYADGSTIPMEEVGLMAGPLEDLEAQHEPSSWKRGRQSLDEENREGILNTVPVEVASSRG